jgi:hypothetical protein
MHEFQPAFQLGTGLEDRQTPAAPRQRARTRGWKTDRPQAHHVGVREHGVDGAGGGDRLSELRVVAPIRQPQRVQEASGRVKDVQLLGSRCNRRERVRQASHGHLQTDRNSVVHAGTSRRPFSSAGATFQHEWTGTWYTWLENNGAFGGMLEQALGRVKLDGTA